MSIETPERALKLSNIQSLRGIAALLVVFSHLLIIEQKYSPDQILGQWAGLGMVGVDLFFVISGFIMVYIAWNYQRGIGASIEFLFARASRIYPLYWLISLVVLALYLWRPEAVFSSVHAAPDLIKSFTLWPDTRPPLLIIGWTLIHEMFFYFVFAIILLLRPRLLLPALALWAVTIAVGYLIGLTKTGPLFAILFSPMSFEFLAGALAGWLFKKYSTPLGTPFGISALVIGIITMFGVLIYANTKHQGMPEYFAVRALYFTIPAAFIVYGLAGVETLGVTLGRLMEKLGNVSYSLYLTHILTLSLLGRLWRPIASNSIWDNLIALILLPLLAVVIASLCWRIAENPMLQITSKIRKKFSQQQKP